MKVRYHVYKDLKMDRSATSDEQIAAAANEKVRRLRYSFVCAVYHKRRHKLYLGATNPGGDILVEFDVATEKFRSLKAMQSGIFTSNDVKIHKGLALDEAHDALYFATATLADMEHMIESKGGVLVRYDIGEKSFASLGRPVQGEFYQSSCWDFDRKLAYLFTARLGFAVYDFEGRKLIRYESMESVPHNSCLDDAGGVWGTHTAGSHKFFRFNPASMKFEFPNVAFPNAAEAANIQYPGAGPVDCMVNGGNGFIYTTNALGELYRIDTLRRGIEYLGKPFWQRRVPALAMGDDGWLYMSGGYRPTSMLARYQIAEKRFEYLGEIRHADGSWMEYVHEIKVVGNKVFAMETDNMIRNGYLWECTV